MITRPAQDNDIPAIVQLLKLSLGEDRMPKTEAFWRWKHVDNPFGRSPVLLAFEGDALVGVRAFMRWEWRKHTNVYKAVRAVDTATHPSHQGKGIFRKLTMDLVDQCKAEGVDFIFNTPNSKSRPGYLKMGWRSAGRLRIGARPILSSGSPSKDFQKTYTWRDDAVSFSTDSVRMVTNASASYYSWRYGANPTIRYHRLTGESGTYSLFFRLKPYRLGTEFRVCDFVVKEKSAWKSLKSHLLQAAGDSGANLLSWGATNDASFSWLPALPLGPVVTVRPLQEVVPDFSFNAWSPSLGDLEVF